MATKWLKHTFGSVKAITIASTILATVSFAMTTATAEATTKPTRLVACHFVSTPADPYFYIWNVRERSANCALAITLAHAYQASLEKVQRSGGVPDFSMGMVVQRRGWDCDIEPPFVKAHFNVDCYPAKWGAPVPTISQSLFYFQYRGPSNQ